jgi:hypothetical protein
VSAGEKVWRDVEVLVEVFRQFIRIRDTPDGG